MDRTDEILKLATSLAYKAEKTHDSADAMRLTQAALNLAHAANVVENTKNLKK